MKKILKNKTPTKSSEDVKIYEKDHTDRIIKYKAKKRV
jgi:hypothetical protein